jgi:hypothetical protein
MREQDQKGEIEFAKEEGKEEKEIEAVIGFYGIGVTIENIAKALKTSEEKVREIIQQHRK